MADDGQQWAPIHWPIDPLWLTLMISVLLSCHVLIPMATMTSHSHRRYGWHSPPVMSALAYKAPVPCILNNGIWSNSLADISPRYFMHGMWTQHLAIKCPCVFGKHAMHVKCLGHESTWVRLDCLTVSFRERSIWLLSDVRWYRILRGRFTHPWHNQNGFAKPCKQWNRYR